MRTCIIFNAVAKAEKAQRFRRLLDAIKSQCAIKATRAPGDGRVLAAEAVREGCDTIVAAGGEGTLNEVLNGIGDEPGGFKRARLGLLQSAMDATVPDGLTLFQKPMLQIAGSTFACSGA